MHRYGSNIHNGAYYFNKDLTNTLSHYSAGRNVNIPALEARYNLLASRSDAEVAARKAASPLYARTRRALPKYFTVSGEVDFPDLFEGVVKQAPPAAEPTVISLINELNANGGRWLTPLPETVNPYIGDGPATPYLGPDYMSRHVGDLYDTSPFPYATRPTTPEYANLPPPPAYIVTRDWITRMGQLISYISPVTS